MRSFLHENEKEAHRLVKEVLSTCGDYLLVDRIVDESDNSIRAVWTVPVDGAWFRTDGAGKNLLLPGTVTTEHLVQAGEVLIFRARGGRPESDGVPVLAKIRSARFRAMVRPGDCLESELKLTEQVGAAYYVSGKVSVNGKIVLKAELSFTATEAVSKL